MRNVPDAMTTAWQSERKFGDQRAVVRATIHKQNLRRFPYDTAFAQGGFYDDNRHRAGHFTSYIFGDNSPYIEVRNIQSCTWDRSVGQDAATFTLTLLNAELTPIGVPKDNPTEPDEFEKPGYFTFNRGDQVIAINRWGYGAETGWNGVIMPDMMVKTFEGYGVDPDSAPNEDVNLMQSGTWMVDKVTYTNTGQITVEGRDLARLLLDSIVFPPAVPLSEYPLSWVHTQTVNIPGRDVHGGDWSGGLQGRGGASSSNDAYIDTDLTNEPFSRYVGPTGGVDGHHDWMPIASHSLVGSTGGLLPDDNEDLFWRSTGQDARHDFVWWQFNADDTLPVGGLRLSTSGGPYRVYVSIHNGTKWVGKKTIPYAVNGEDDSPGNVDIGADIPFVMSVIADRWHNFDVILPKAYAAKRIRLTFTHLAQGTVGEHPFRAGLRSFQAYTAGSVSDLSFGKGEVETVIGNYGDFTHIIKWVCAWAGWYWPPHATGMDYIRINATYDTEAVKDYITFNNFDPVLPKGRVWGDFMKTGTHGKADLTVDMFDKKPLMDIINYVRDLIGFLFFIDETGGAIWRMPNYWDLGNYVSPDYLSETRLPGKRGRHGRTTDIIEIDEDETLLGYQVVLDSADVRDRIFVANAVGGIGIVIKGYNPNDVGLKRVGGWSDQHFATKQEARVMADMIGVQQMFSYRVGQAVIPGNPAIQVDDQIRIFERVTDETYYHYVAGIHSELDMTEGKWLYTMDTHWLGERPSDAWAIRVDELSNVTQQYLSAVGYAPSDSEDNDDEDPPAGGGG